MIETPDQVTLIIRTQKHNTMNIYNIIILDSSGSMYELRNASIDGVNETLETIKAAREEDTQHEQYFSLYTFSSIYPDNIYPIVRKTPIGQTHPLTPEDYRPKGMTPLFDAIGQVITIFRNTMEPEDKALVTIITDGYENSSSRYSQEDIRQLISQQKEMGWIFAYIGANQDSICESRKLGIRNALDFSADEDGTRTMWERDKKGRMKFFEALKNVKDADSYADEMAPLGASYFDEE